MTSPKASPTLIRIRHRTQVILGAGMLTLCLFLVLPVIQSISSFGPVKADLMVTEVGMVPPPPAPPEDDIEEEPEPEEEPPELLEDAVPLDLSQLELVMNAGFSSGGYSGGVIGTKLSIASVSGEDANALFSLADLDQKPRPIYQPSPAITAEMRSRAPGTVYVVFVVDLRGKVINPVIQKSSDPVFERAALSAIKKWKFEPGKRKGTAVRFRMRVPMTFPKG